MIVSVTEEVRLQVADSFFPNAWRTVIKYLWAEKQG